jgi:hypothetical protein
MGIQRAFRALALLALCVGASGCATIVSGTTQPIAINTDPQGADCSFTRDNVLVARINPTPGVASVQKSSGSIGVLCKKADYQDVAGIIESQFQAATLGNILLGGVIGVVVDAASGAMSKYPESVTFTMIPAVFDSPEARDAFFARMRETFEKEFAVAIEQIKLKCGSDCENQLLAAEAGRRSKLAEIEERRLLAKVKSTG